jgi:hypothetical protein
MGDSSSINDLISGSSAIGVRPRARVRIFGGPGGRRFAEVLRSAHPTEIGRLSVFSGSLMMGSFPSSGHALGSELWIAVKLPRGLVTKGRRVIALAEHGR